MSMHSSGWSKLLKVISYILTAIAGCITGDVVL